MIIRRSVFVLQGLFCGVGLLVSWIPGPIAWEIFQLLTLALAAIWFLDWAASRESDAGWTWMLLPFLCVIAWGTAQILLHDTVYAFATRVDILRWVAFTCVFFLGYHGISTREGEGIFCKVLTVFGVALAVLSMLQFFLSNGKIFWTFLPAEPASGFGPFLNHDHFASFLLLIIPIAAVEAIRDRGERWIYILITAVLYAIVIASASRAGFALATLEIILLVVLFGLPGWVLPATLGLTVIFGFVVGADRLYERLQEPNAFASRLEVARVTVQIIKSSPWTGTGLGTWTIEYPAFAERDIGLFANAAHNDWLQWFADGGLPMFSLMLILFGGCVAVVRRKPWALGVAMVFVHSIIDFPMQGKFLPAMVFLTLGVATRAAQRPRGSRINAGRPERRVQQQPAG